MDRRRALGHLTRLTASGSLAATGVFGAPLLSNAREAVDPAAAFASSFKGIPARIKPHNVRFDKPLPKGLSGTLYRNGPGQMQLGETKFNHWFDGDGMIQSYRLSGSELVHHGRRVNTARNVKESKAGRYLWASFGTSFPDAQSIRQPDEMNTANTSVLPLDDELLALWEGGSAHSIDSETLETRGLKVFSSDTEGLSFSAHPKVDAAGKIWNYGYLGGSGKLVLYEINRRGALLKVKMIDAPNADMVHDFAVTERYLVFILSPVHYRAVESGHPASVLQQLTWDSKGAVEIVVVDKNTFEVKHRMQAPTFFAFHFGNAWEDGDSVRVDVARTSGFDVVMESITQATMGQRGPRFNREQAMQLVLDLRRQVARIETLPVAGVEFPRFDQRFTGKRTKNLFVLGESEDLTADAYGFGRVMAVQAESGKVQGWSYPPGVIAEEHIFVAAPGKTEGVGWLLGTAFDSAKSTTSLQVFDAQAVDAGPIATAHLPYHLPLGFHGQFVPG